MVTFANVLFESTDDAMPPPTLEALVQALVQPHGAPHIMLEQLYQCLLQVLFLDLVRRWRCAVLCAWWRCAVLCACLRPDMTCLVKHV